MEFAKAVDVDSRSPVIGEGPRYHGPVLEGRGLAMDSGWFGSGRVRTWWRKITQPGLVIIVTGFVSDVEHFFNVVL